MQIIEETYEKIGMHSIRKGEVKVLDDIYMIEDVAMGMKELKDKMEFLKEYKKRKTKAITEAMDKIQKEHDMLKNIILATLESKKEKTPLSFPGSCKISTRNQKDEWIIDDEDAFIDVLKAEKELDNVAEEMTSYKIIKKEANKLLEVWKKSGKVPDCVTREESKPSLSITYLEEEEAMDNEDLPAKGETPDFDQLDFS